MYIFNILFSEKLHWFHNICG